MISLTEPRKGIHSIRLFDIAIVDVLLTGLASYFLDKKNFLLVFIILILFSIIIHTMLGIKTKTNSMIFDE